MSSRLVTAPGVVAEISGMPGVDPARFPLTLPRYGNMGPAAVPFTLAQHIDQLRAEDRILLLGIGSGLNTSYAEIVW